MAAEKALEIRLLGEIALRRDGEAVTLPRSRKTRSLLAYLVATGRTHRRERLCSMFWDVPDDPRGALRWSLSKLRTLVDETDRKRIVADRESVTFDATEVDVDLFSLRAQLAGGLEAVVTKQLADLAKTFHGEFLEGLDLPNCPEFQAWCVAEREEVQRLQAKILRTLVERLSGEAEVALPHARVLTQLDPYDEAARARLMRLLAATGRRREAEQQYELGLHLLKEVGARTDALDQARQELRGGTTQPARDDPMDPSVARATVPPDRGPEDPAALMAAEEAATQRDTPPLPAEPSIIVLPLANSSDDAEQDYFSHAMTEDLTTLLSGVSSLFVIAPDTALALEGQVKDPRQVASRVGVHYVLEGSVSKADGEVQLVARLRDGATSNELWTRCYDVPLGEVSGLLCELAGTIVGTMDPALGRDAIRPGSRRQPGNMAARELCQRGRWHFYRGTRHDLDQARALFEQACELDANLCQAWSGLAETHCQLVELGFAVSANGFFEAAQKAVQLDPEDAAARCVLGKAHVIKRQHEAAVLEFETALTMAANLASACHGLGAAYVFSGRPKDAMPYLERARRLNPCGRHLGDVLERMAEAHLLMRDHDQAVIIAERALQHPPFRWSRQAVLISALGHLGRLDEARDVLEGLLQHQPDFSLEFVRERHLFAGQVALAYVAEPQLFTDQDEVAHYLDGLRKAGVASGTPGLLQVVET